MDHDTRGDAIINTITTREQDEDHRDAMEVDGAPSMMIDTSRTHDSNVDTEAVAVESSATPVSPMMISTNAESQSRDLGSTLPDTPRSALHGSREPPAFDEDTERPRQRRRYHVTVEDENDGEIRTVPDAAPVATGGTSAGEDEVAVLVTAPPRMGDLTIHTPRSTTPPPPATVESAMQDVVPSDPSAPTAPSPESPHLGTVPLPDVPPPPQARNPNDPPDRVMQAARRLTTAPDGNADQMQADLALLAPYIAAQAMAAAFPPGAGGGRPPGGGAPNPGNDPPNAPNGQQQPGEQGGANNAAPPPPPPFPFFPFMFGGPTEVPPDPKRAERLANGLKIVEDGLLKRWRAVCGEEGAVCAVCYGELLEEPGIEKDKGKAKEEDDKVEAQADDDQNISDDEAHERELREALKRREEMEKLEQQEKELKLETAVLAFPCGHVFHRTCLLPWLSRHTTCPTCRFDIDPKSDTLTLPADDGMPAFLGPNGFNFSDFFTVGPVLRMPRAQAPNLGPRPMPGHNHNHTHEHGPGPRRERRGSSQPASDNRRPRPSGGEPAGNAGASRSMTDLFDSLFGPLFESAGIPARRPAANAQAPPNQEPAGQEPAAPAAQEPVTSTAQETSTQETATQPAQPSEPPATNPPPSIADLGPPSTRPNQPATEYRPIDYNRPLAMFGRPSPRRPPQPVTPAWMRPPRAPPATSTPSTSSASASTSAAGASSASASTPSTSTTPTTPRNTPRVPSGSSADGSRGLGQIRAIVSNLIPRRLSSTARVPSSNASIRSNRSSESTGSNSAAQAGPRVAPSPISPRAGIRAILQGPTAMLRDLASRRPADPEPEDRSRDSVDSTLPGQNPGDDMPELESDTEDGSTYSEDDAHDSEEDADMPALEPVVPRVTRTPAASTSENQSTPGNDAQPPPPASRSTEEPAQPPQSTPDPANGTQPPTFGPPRPPTDNNNRPPADNNPGLMDNIITLRIDLGHADGRDETIIVPLLFNPNGRTNGQNQREEPPAAAQPPPPPSRQRTSPPQKKWVPPEPIKTFRQVVEEKEREAGWRCDDPACLLGPADDEEPSNEHPIKPMYSIMRSLSPDDEPVRYKIEDGIRVYAGGEDVRVKGENPVCAHQLHPECLVTSARVNGWGPDHNSKSSSRVTLRCPVCRLEGNVERQIWDAGVETEEA